MLGEEINIYIMGVHNNVFLTQLALPHLIKSKGNVPFILAYGC